MPLLLMYVVLPTAFCVRLFLIHCVVDSWSEPWEPSKDPSTTTNHTSTSNSKVTMESLLSRMRLQRLSRPVLAILLLVEVIACTIQLTTEVQ